MSGVQGLSLFCMFLLGVYFAAISVDNWDRASRLNRAIMVAWVLFWVVPPLWFIWTKGVMG